MQKLIHTKKNGCTRPIPTVTALQKIYDEVCLANNFKNKQKPCRRRFRKYLIRQARTKHKEFMSPNLKISGKDIKKLLNPKCNVVPLTAFDFLKLLLLEMPKQTCQIEACTNLSTCMASVPIECVRFLDAELKNKIKELNNMLVQTTNINEITEIKEEINKLTCILNLCQEFFNMQKSFNSNNKIKDYAFMLNKSLICNANDLLRKCPI